KATCLSGMVSHQNLGGAIPPLQCWRKRKRGMASLSGPTLSRFLTSSISTKGDSHRRARVRDFAQFDLSATAGLALRFAYTPWLGRVERSTLSVAMAPGAASTLCNEAQAPTGEMAVTPPSIRKSAPTTYEESSDAR